MIQARRLPSGAILLEAAGISVPHGFTTRPGGVSQGQLASLNIGVHRGDHPERVLENYKILGQALGFAPEKAVLSHQVHSDIVLRVGSAQAGAGLTKPPLPECDALITGEPGISLVIFSADCTPVLLHDPVTGAVGAAHAGWRGTAANIVGKTVAAMVREFGTRPADLRAAIGPCIGPCCFETGPEVAAAMEAVLGPEAEAYLHPQGEKYYVDLKGVNAALLRRAGVQQIEISSLCTACRPDWFWSHRKTGNARGSQGAVILCKEEHPCGGD